MTELTNEEHAKCPWIECWVIVKVNHMSDDILRGRKGSCIPFRETFGVIVIRQRHFLNRSGLVHLSTLVPNLFVINPCRGFALNQVICWRRRHVERLADVVMSQR